MVPLVVAALEFCRTNSGFAFLWRSDFKTDPLKIHTYSYACYSNGFHSCKTPTCLLLDKEKRFMAFGYDAEDRYADLVDDNEQDDYYFFDRFTMSLHNNENVTRDMVLKDKTGKQCSALEVFTLSIKYLVDCLMEEVQILGLDLRDGEIIWVLTVPAAWTDSGKQLMRESAEKAGLHAENVLLITEPEAAFIYCHYLPTTGLHGYKPGIMINDSDTKSMVVDLGDMTADITVIQSTYNGGTTDITVHEKASNCQLKQLCRVTGNDCGGTSIDARFFKVLQEIVGEKVIAEFKEKEPLSYIDLVREFEALKRLVRTEDRAKVNLRFPFVSIDRKCQEFGGKSLQFAIASSSYVNEITLLNDLLGIKVDLIIKLFTPTIDNIITLMKNTASNRSTNGLSTIMMVGGFSECPLIQQAVQAAFPGKQIIIPEHAGMSVLKGAVLFGHQPDYIRPVKGDSMDTLNIFYCSKQMD